MNVEEVREDAGPTASLVPGLSWGVRASFVDYVAGSPDGGVHGADGVETDGQGLFRFPVHEVVRDGARWSLAFVGQVRFTAHFGALDVEISRPRIDLGESGALTVLSRGAPVVIARIEAADPVEVDGWCVWPPLPALLTAEGSALFGGVYAEGEPLDPLRIAVASPAAARR